MKEWIRQYGTAFVVTAITVGLVYQYAAVRYGVGGLSTFNKATATSGLFLLGIVLLMGPLSRMFSVFDSWLKYRKEVGVLVFYLGFLHAYFSMFVLSGRGPWGLYLSSPWSAYPGLVALTIMFFLIVISFPFVERTLGTRVWWKLQYWGARIAFLLIAVHMTVLKSSGWMTWLTTRGTGTAQGIPSLPPLAILVAVFSAFVLVLRFSEFFGQQAAKRITQLSFLFTVGFTVWLFLS